MEAISSLQNCGWRRQPPDVEGSCEYIEWAVANSQQRVVLQLQVLAMGKQFLSIKKVMTYYTGLCNWLALVNTV
jgi:hypothetical protein